MPRELSRLSKPCPRERTAVRVGSSVRRVGKKAVTQTAEMPEVGGGLDRGWVAVTCNPPCIVNTKVSLISLSQTHTHTHTTHTHLVFDSEGYTECLACVCQYGRGCAERCK